jgi:hypothetical protein
LVSEAVGDLRGHRRHLAQAGDRDAVPQATQVRRVVAHLA